MEISNDEAEALLSHPNNGARLPVFTKDHRGMPEGTPRISPVFRTILGVAAHHDSIRDTAKLFGVGTHTVQAAKVGEHVSGAVIPEVKENVEAIISKGKSDVRKGALDALAGMFADTITQENLSTLKPREAVSAAKDLAVVVEKLSPKSAGGNVAVFVHAPQVKQEETFGEPIEVEYNPMDEGKLE
jgi:hypothetical protein